jgi:hypothetical protein
MSRFAAALLLAASLAAQAAAEPRTAEQVLARHRAATSIGPDPCRSSADEEIVVCGYRTSPYALPPYDPTDDDDASRYGGNRVGQMAAIAESESACAKQGAFCQPPAAVDIFTVLPVVIKGIKALVSDE